MSPMPVNGSDPEPTVGVKAPPAVGMQSMHASAVVGMPSAVGMQSVRHGASLPVSGRVVVLGRVVVVGTSVAVVVTGTSVTVVVTGTSVTGVVVAGTSVTGVEVAGTSVTGVVVLGEAETGGAVVESLVPLATADGAAMTKAAKTTAVAMIRFTVILSPAVVQYLGRTGLRDRRGPAVQERPESPSVTHLSPSPT